MQFRKLAAVGGSALMAGMSLAAPALAAVTNVADIGALAGTTDSTAVFPTFYIGADAAPSDVAAAINLAAYLAGNVYTTKTISASGGATSADGVTMRLEIGWFTNVTKDFDLGTSDLFLSTVARGGRTATFLKDGSISIGGTEYKYFERIGGYAFDGTSTYQLLYGDSSAAGTYEAAYKDVGLSTPGDDLHYALVFETAPYIGTNNLTGKTIKFLGKDYTITSSSTTEIKLSPSAGGDFIGYGKSSVIQGFTVEVTAVGTASTDPIGLKITKGGETKTMSLTAGEIVALTFGGETTSFSVTRVTPGSAGGADILVGASALKLTNGNLLAAPYSDWTVQINRNDGGGTTGNAIANITLRYIQPRSGFTGTYPVLLSGKAIEFPEKIATLSFEGYETRDYIPLSITPILADLTGDGSATDTGVKITAGTKIINVGGGIFADAVSFDNDGSSWRYQNTTGGWQTATSAPSITLTDGTLSFGGWECTVVLLGCNAAADLIVNITLPSGTSAMESGRLANDTTWYIEYDEPASGQGVFGNITSFVGDNDDDSGDNPTYLSFGGPFGRNGTFEMLPGGVTTSLSLAYGGGSPKARSTFVDPYGVKLKSASTSIVQLDVPKSAMYADIVLGKPAGTAATGTTSKEPVQITFDVAKLDSEVSDWSTITTDAVVVGGPAVNKAAASLLGKTYPAKGEESGIPTDAALVQVFQAAFGSGKVAVLVAGYNAADTELAVAAIQAGKVTLAKAKAKISGTVAAPVVEELA